MLVKMGWQKGQGLGKDNTGVAEPVGEEERRGREGEMEGGGWEGGSMGGREGGREGGRGGEGERVDGREGGMWKEWRKRGEDSFVMAPHAK